MRSFLSRLGHGLLAALMAAIVVVPFLEIALRAAGTSIAYLTVLVPDLFVWATFLGAILATLDGTHLGIPALRERLPRRARLRVEGLQAIAVVVFVAGVIAGSVRVLEVSIRHGDRAPLGYPAWWVELALPVGLCGMAIAAIVTVARRARSAEPTTPVEADEELP